MKQLVILSGPVCAGKTTLADRLASDFRFKHLKTQDMLKLRGPKVESSRKALQAFGAGLDRKTKGQWVRDTLQTIMERGEIPEEGLVVLDSVRIQDQVEALRESYGRRVFHVHLTAPLEVLAKRYEVRRRRKEIIEFASYDDVREDPTERKIEKLKHTADVLLDTKRCIEGDIVVRVACHLGLYGRAYSRAVDVLVGGQFGSEGKGQIAAYLATEYDVLVRVGGPNAGHTVYAEPDPITFHHLPSGTLANLEARLVLGPGAVIRVPDLQKEIGECKVDVDRLSIDPQAMVISDEDISDEDLLKRKIGSTGQGVGLATARKIVQRGESCTKLARHIPELKPYIRDSCEVLEEAYQDGRRVFLEGTQGTGLSIHHGHYPHVTSRDTTMSGCLAEAGISPARVRKIVMVCRSNPIRVENPSGSTSGPMSQEITWKEVARRSKIKLKELIEREKTSTTKRRRRVGEFDWVWLRKAASLNGPTDIAVTFADYLSVTNRKARRFEQLEDDTIRFIEEVERVGAAPVSLISTRFHSRGIIDRRAW